VGEMRRTRSDSRGLLISIALALTYLTAVASVVYFYWGWGLVLDASSLSYSLLPIFLVLMGVFLVLMTSWRYASDVIRNAKGWMRLAARSSLSAQHFSALLAWAIVCGTYLLANLLMSGLGLASSLLSLCAWEDCVFYAFVLSQLASSFLVAFVSFLIRHVD